MTEGFREDFRHDILPDSSSKKKVKKQPLCLRHRLFGDACTPNAPGVIEG